MKETQNPLVRRGVLFAKKVPAAEITLTECKVLLILSGDFTFQTGKDDLVHCGPNSFVFLPAGFQGTVKSKGLRAVLLSFAWSSPDEIEPPFDRHFIIEDFASERETFGQIADACTLETESGTATASAMLKLELIRAADTVCEDALPVRMASELNAYLRDHCEDEISNTEIGAIFGYHPFYVSQLLKKKLGITLHQYILRYKLRLATQLLLNTDRTITEIAEQTGFKDSSYFTKIFKSEKGMTPKDFRTNCASETI